MIKKSQDYVTIFNKTIYKAVTTTGWAVVIMPDSILIDNYHHGYTHIHFNPNKHDLKEKIKNQDQKQVYNIVCKHVHENEGLKVKKLIKELK